MSTTDYCWLVLTALYFPPALASGETAEQIKD